MDLIQTKKQHPKTVAKVSEDKDTNSITHDIESEADDNISIINLLNMKRTVVDLADNDNNESVEEVLLLMI